MGKILLISIIVLVLGAGGYFFLFNKQLPLLSNQKSQIAQQPTNQLGQVPTAGNSAQQAPIITTDESIDNDMTALEKDLADLNKMDSSFSGDLNGI